MSGRDLAGMTAAVGVTDDEVVRRPTGAFPGPLPGLWRGAPPPAPRRRAGFSGVSEVGQRGCRMGGHGHVPGGDREIENAVQDADHRILRALVDWVVPTVRAGAEEIPKEC